MSETVLKELADAGAELSAKAYDALNWSNPRSLEEVQSLLRILVDDPTLDDIDFASISAVADRKISAAYRAAAKHEPPRMALMSRSTLPPFGLPPLGSTAMTAAKLQKQLSEPSINVNQSGWAVKNQGQRGTCVAHALVASVEYGSDVDYSEQYTFWAAKVHGGDPSPGSDGTLLCYAGAAVAAVGFCEESLWPYVDSVVPNSVHHETTTHPVLPSAAARSQGDKRKRSMAHFAEGSMKGGNARALYDALVTWKRPVAITVPVHVTARGLSTWNALSAQVTGRVMDPPKNTISDGGHAVCVVGFNPDPVEAMGGYFVIRNSWGTADFGASASGANVWDGPEPGYGTLSASFIERYLWELCVP